MGYNDEVLDVKFLGKGDSHIVVATNSCQLKVFELLTNSCQILYGHTGQSPAEGSMCVSLYLDVKCIAVFLFVYQRASFHRHFFFLNLIYLSVSDTVITINVGKTGIRQSIFAILL